MLVKFSLRELRGLGILALGGQIMRESDTTFLVKSQSNQSSFHMVVWKDDKWVCDCEDFVKRCKPCKHIYAVNFLLDLPRIVLSNSQAFGRFCPYCGSTDVRPKGFRYNKSGPLRMFKCLSCGRRFKDGATSESCITKAALAVIATDLYYKGLSLRCISDHLWQIYGVKRSASTIHYWVSKITEVLKKAFEDVRLDVGDKWLADETVVKIDGEPMYLWNIMDYETRCYIASLLTSGRDAEDAIKAIKEAIRNAGKLPKALVTDGLKSYVKAVRLLNLQINHISNAGLAKHENNNMVERLHGTIKDWVKRRRGVKKDFTEGYRIYYNHVRSNMALGGRAPARDAREKWVSIILMPKKREHNVKV